MKTFPNTTSPFRAFTLIELLTVISIIGILAAVIIPTVGKVRESAYRAECVSNMRQISAALFAYAAEHKQVLPAVSYPEWGPGNTANPPDHKGAWQWAIWTYAGQKENAYDIALNGWLCGPNVRGKASYPKNIFQCKTTQRTVTMVPGLTANVNNGTCYGLNPSPLHTHGFPTQATQVITPILLAYAEIPSKTLLLAESYNYSAAQYDYLRQCGMLPHEGTTNIAFYDGHIERWSWARIQERGDQATHTLFWRGTGPW